MRKRKPEELKDTGIKWIGGIPDQWDTVKIRWLGKVENGATPKSSVDVYWNGPVLWATPEDLSNRKKEICDTKKKLSKLGLKNCGASLVPKGSLLLSTRAPIGYATIAQNSITTNQGCKSIVPKKNTDSNFLYYQFVYSEPFLQSLGSGSTFTELSTSELKNFPLAWPSIEEQKAIATFLDHKTEAIDQLIEKKRQLIEKLKEKRQALITRAVTKGLNPDAPMKDSGIEWLGEIPKHWGVVQIRRLISTLTDFEANGSFSSVKANVDLDQKEKYAWYVRATDLENNRVGTNGENRTTDKASYNFLSKTKLFGNELLITKRGEIGKVYLMPNTSKPATLAPNLYMLRFKAMNPKYAFYFMKSDFGSIQLKSADLSTTIGAIYKDDVKELVITLPPKKEQNEIVAKIDQIVNQHDATINKALKQISLIKEYRQSLISAAVTGKIDVRDANCRKMGKRKFQN